MNKTTEALKLAEEALRHFPSIMSKEALAAIREALADAFAASGKPITKPVKKNTPYCKSVPMCAKPCGDESCVEPVKQEPVAFDKWDVDEAKRILPMMRQGVALLEYVAGALPKSAEPVKQEPVAWINTNGAVNKLREAGWAMNTAQLQPVKQEPVAYVYEKDVAGIGMRKDVAFTKHVEVGTDLYAAPVDAKDIRAEAYQQGRNDMKEEAAKFAYKMRFRSWWTVEAIADGIRGLK